MPLPQRRHRKMLRDGSCEVWPQDAEAIFLDGLKEYWRSPWANYSRGRSRWRNQYLVDYLQKAGITRSKKQVASHIQVLRNMWKGHPEFQLVAGPEELYSDGDPSSSTATSNSDALSHTGSFPSSSSRRHSYSSISGGSHGSPPSTPHSNDSESLSDASFSIPGARKIKQEPSLTLTRVIPHHHPHGHSAYAPSLPMVADSDMDIPMSGVDMDSLEIPPNAHFMSTHHQHSPQGPTQESFSSSTISMPASVSFQSRHSSSGSYSPMNFNSETAPPRVCGFSLWSEGGMPPKYTDIDDLGSISSSGSAVASMNAFSNSAPILQTTATIDPSQLSMPSSTNKASTHSFTTATSSPSSLPPSTPAIGHEDSPQMSTPTPRVQAPQEPLIRTSLRFELHLPSVSDPRCPQSISGFSGALFFASPLPAETNARCLTQVHVDGALVSREISQLILAPPEAPFTGFVENRKESSVSGGSIFGMAISGSESELEESHSNSGDGVSASHSQSFFVQNQNSQHRSQKYSALLPDSWLTRCRWLNTGTGKRAVVTQQVFISRRSYSLVSFNGHVSPSRSRSLSAPVALGIRVTGDNREGGVLPASLGAVNGDGEAKFQNVGGIRDETLFVIVYHLKRGDMSMPSAELTYWSKHIGEESVSSTINSTGFRSSGVKGEKLDEMPSPSPGDYQGYLNGTNNVNGAGTTLIHNTNANTSPMTTHFVNAFSTFSPSQSSSSSSSTSAPPQQQRAQPRPTRVNLPSSLDHPHPHSQTFSGSGIINNNSNSSVGHGNLNIGPRAQSHQYSSSSHLTLTPSYHDNSPPLSFYSTSGEILSNSTGINGAGYSPAANGSAFVNGHYGVLNVGGFGGGINVVSVGGGIGIESWNNQGAMPLLPLF